jgi:hypothetical protein
MSSPISLSYLNNLIVDPDPAVPVRGATGRDRLDEDAQLLQPRIRAHPHTCHTKKVTHTKTSKKIREIFLLAQRHLT